MNNIAQINPTTRRRPENRALRRLMLAGNLMAHQLEQIDTTADNPFANTLRDCLEAWQMAVEDMRQDQITAHDTRWEERA